MEFGVKFGMVGLVEECWVGLDFIKGYYSYIVISFIGNVLRDYYVFFCFGWLFVIFKYKYNKFVNK